MAIRSTTPSVAISASTSSASAAIPSNFTGYIRVVNPTTALCYVNTGDSGVTATASNIAVGAYSELTLQTTVGDTHVAVLLSASTGMIAVSPSYEG